MPTRHSGSVEEQRALDLFIKLSRAAASVMQSTQCSVREGGLTGSQFGVLDALYHIGPMPIGEIARKHLCSQNSMCSVVDTMERSGTVRRIRSEDDRRIVQVELTQEGKELFERVWPTNREAIVKAMARLSPEEQETLSGLLKKLGCGQAQTQNPGCPSNSDG